MSNLLFIVFSESPDRNIVYIRRTNRVADGRNGGRTPKQTDNKHIITFVKKNVKKID